MPPTYPPLALYAFTTSTWIYNSLISLTLTANRNYPVFPSKLVWFWERQQVLPAFNKAIAIFSDIGIGVLIYYFLRRFLSHRPRLALTASAVYLFNPAVWYTSTIWGQIESMPLFFILLSYWLVYSHKFLPAHLAFAAALLSKQSTIIFFPVFLAFSLLRMGFKLTLKGLVLQIVLLYFVYLPFFTAASPFWPITTYLNRIRTGSGSDYISDHAFNLWALTTRLAKISDSRPAVFSLPSGTVATAAFGILYLCLLLLLIKRPGYKNIFFLNAVIPALAFLVLTRMHERYFAPVLPFLVLAAAFSPGLWLVYVAGSVVHLANLYHLWWFPPIPPVIAWLSLWENITLLIIILSAAVAAMAVIYVRNQISSR